MSSVNDKYKNQVEHSLLLNHNPLTDNEIVDDRLIIKPKKFSKPQISDADKQIIINELAAELTHYGLSVEDLDDKNIKVSADDFELIVPKRLVIPYDDAIFASILKHHQEFVSGGIDAP